MLLSYDKNGNVYQGIRERGTCRTPEMVMDSHLALGEYEEKKLKDLARVKKAESEKRKAEANLNRQMNQRRNQYARLKTENAFQYSKKQNQLRKGEKFLRSELMEEALKQPPMGFDYSPTLGNPLIGFGAVGEIITDPGLTGEAWGEVYESENFGNTMLTAAMLPESYMMDETLGFSLNPFKAIGSVVKATIKIGGVIYDVGSSAARTAIRVADKQITGGKISAIIDDADKTIKNIRDTTYERVDDIAKNASLTTEGILKSALTEAKGISQGKLGTGVVLLGKTAVGTVSRTYEDTKEAWFDTKEATEETATGRLLTRSVAEVQQKTDPGWYATQTHKALSKGGLNIPLISTVYQGVDKYSGGLLTKVTSAGAMPGKLIRGNAGLQLTDERVSKAEFIQNMVFYAQVAMTVVSFGAAGAVLMVTAQNMKNGPLGGSKEGEIIFGLMEISAVAASGGTASIKVIASKYAAKEVQRKAAGVATKQVAKQLGLGDTPQAMLQMALLSGSYKEASLVAGKTLVGEVVITEVSKKTGSTGGLLSSMALEATWATAGAPNKNEKGETPKKSEIFCQSVKQQVMSESRNKVVGIAKQQATKQAMKTLPKSQVDLLVSTGEMGYSAYESDKGFTAGMQKALKEKTYDKVLLMADKKQNQLIKKQRQKVDAITEKIISAKEKALKLSEMSSQELQQKAQMEAEKQVLKAENKVLDEIATVENQIYDLQVARDHALDKIGLAPQHIQDQLEENANALQVKIAAVPGMIQSKAEREVAVVKLRAQRAMEMVERNKKRIEQFNATAELGEAIAKMGEEARQLRERALNMTSMDAEELLKKAIALEMQMIEMYMRLQAMENMAMRMNYEAAIYDAQAGLEIAATQEGRYPLSLSQRYDYRHPIAVYGYLKEAQA